MGEITSEPGTLALVRRRARKLSVHQIWPTVAIGFGLAVTVVWICFLGYGLVKVVELVI